MLFQIRERAGDHDSVEVPRRGKMVVRHGKAIEKQRDDGAPETAAWRVTIPNS
jgi:hypothetical protein